MTINKNFIVKNGLDVAESLINADGSTRKVGIGTTVPERELDIRGDVAFTGTLYAPAEITEFTTTGTVNSSAPDFVSGVTTSLFRLYDRIDDGPGGSLRSNTQVVNIGIGSIGISPSHTRLIGSSSITINITRQVYAGDDGDILVSRGENKTPIWSSLEDKVEISTDNTSTDTFFPTFADGIGSTSLKITDELSFIPSSGNLGIGTTIPTEKLSVIGNASILGELLVNSIVSTSFESESFTVGLGVTDVVVNGDLRVTGIATFGTSSITIDGDNNTISIGTDVYIASGIATFGTDGVTIDGNNNTISIGTDVYIASGIATFGTDGVTIDGNNRTVSIGTDVTISSGIISATRFVGEFVGSASTTTNVEITTLSTEESKYYPTFATGIGSTSVGLTTTALFIDPVTNNLGLGTDNARYDLDIVGDIGFDGRIYAPTAPFVYASRSATVDGANRDFVGINTSNIVVGDLIDDGEGGRLAGVTTVTSIGIGSVGIIPQHSLLFGSASIDVNLINTEYITPGREGTVLVSSGSTGPVTWKTASSLINVGVTTTSVDDNYKVVFTTQYGESGVADLKVNEDGLVFNPSTTRLGIGSTAPTSTVDVIGDAKFSGIVTAASFSGTATTGLTLANASGIATGTISTERLAGSYDINITGTASTATNVIGGIASVTQLEVSGVTTVTSGVNTVTIGNGNINATGTITATEFIGSGVNLTGIATNLIAGIGIDITNPTPSAFKIASYKPIGKTIFVSQTGNDSNTGLSENHPKRTIKAASAIAFPGDTVKVYPGVYVENNPIVLGKNVAVEGTELRNCVVTPRYLDRDLFHVNNSCHITDLSFVGGDMTNGAAIVALQPLLGVSADRYFDAARMIRYNLDYIAKESVGFLTSTYYIGAGRTQESDPVFEVVDAGGSPVDPSNCSDDIKDIFKAVIHDITRGGNLKCVGAGKSYFDDAGSLVHITGTDINGYSVKDATIDTINYAAGIARAIINNSTWGGFPVGLGTVVTNATYDNTTGITTITATNHGLVKDDAVKIVGLGFTCPSGPGIVTYPSGSLGYIFNVKSVSDANTFEVVVGQSTLPHTYVSGGTVQKYTNFQNDFTQVKDLGIQADPLTGFNNAIDGCANVVSAIRSCVGVVTTIIGYGSTSGIATSYPANSGIGTNSVIGITSAVYDNTSGDTTLIAPNFSVKEGDVVEVRDLVFECESAGVIGTQKYPSGRYGYLFDVVGVSTLTQEFTINAGVSTIPHTYVGGGFVVNRAIGVTTASYDNATGVTTITAPGAVVKVGQFVRLHDLEFSCTSGAGTTTLYPTGNLGYEFRVTEVIGSGTTFVVNTGVSTIPHTYEGGGVVLPPYSPGVGPITQGPYIRNCTNFVPKSIGMKVDGFEAEPGDRDDIGVTGTMSVDSYTQYNQGGIGVSITNGAYSQLVSIFTICDDIAIFTGSGGQCDITNSNSSFGRLGLVADGVGDAASKSIYRYTGVAVTDVIQGNNVMAISGMGNIRPYDGQVCYFGELYNFVDTISVTNGGSGYVSAPRVTISAPEGENGITAQASSEIDAFGRVTAINLVNSGTQYLNPPTVTIDPPPVGVTATADVTKMQPIYYKVDSATLPSAGISTVSFLQTLNNTVSAGTTVYFTRVSLQITSSHSFEWVGSGNDINTAKPALGGVVIPENEVVQDNGGIVVYTSTDQAGNFRIGDGVVINQATGQISGRDFTKALFTTMTPFILALSE